MFWKKPPAPKPARHAAFMTATHEAIQNATAGASWEEKCRVAEALERFAESVRLTIALGRPL